MASVVHHTQPPLASFPPRPATGPATGPARPWAGGSAAVVGGGVAAAEGRTARRAVQHGGESVQHTAPGPSPPHQTVSLTQP